MTTAAKPKTSAAKSKSPAVLTEESVVEEAAPVVEMEAPVVETTVPVVETIDPVSDREERSAKANKVIRHNVYWAVGAGVVPIQFLDSVALIAVQLKMLKELGDVYGVPFKANAGKSAVTALLTGVGAGVLSSGIVGSSLVMSLLRRAPVVGTVVSLATMPSFSAAFTYAVGEVFKHHFVSGGTFLSFNAKAAQARFAQKFAEAKDKGLAAVAA